MTATTISDSGDQFDWPRRIPDFLAPWHGCMEHNHNHCPECRSCDCYDRPEQTGRS